MAVASIAPTSGTIAGGTAVSITGTGFVSGTTVSIAGSPLVNLVVQSSTTITGVTSTTIAVGKGDVVVSGPNGVGTLSAGFEYRIGLAPFGSTVPLGGQAWDMVVADFNEDGIPDLAYVTRSAFIGVRLGDGTGAFPTSAVTSVPGHNLYGLAVADLNGDGHLDVVAADIDNGEILVFHGDGTGHLSYIAPTITGVGPYPERLRLGDVNEDHALDVIIPLFGSGLGTVPSYARVLLGDGAGHFQAPGVNYAVLNGPQSVAVVDMDKDGHLDFFTTNVQSPSISFLKGKGDGTFEPQVMIPVATQNAGLAVADYDRSGRPQVFVTHGASSPILVSSDLAGNFTTKTIATALVGHLTCVVADVNRDGYPDVVAIAISGSQHSVFLNDRKGGFVEYLISGPAWPSCDGMVVAGDFDGDGRIDVALPGPTSSLTIYLNR